MSRWDTSRRPRTSEGRGETEEEGGEGVEAMNQGGGDPGGDMEASQAWGLGNIAPSTGGGARREEDTSSQPMRGEDTGRCFLVFFSFLLQACLVSASFCHLLFSYNHFFLHHMAI